MANGDDKQMASPGQLIKCVSALLGVKEATVAQVDRQLVESGLRRKGGRGSGAVRVNAADATNLLIATAAAPLFDAAVSRAAKTVASIGGLPEERIEIELVDEAADAKAAKTKRDIAKRLHLPLLAKLPRDHSFRDGLWTLIQSSMIGDLGMAIEQWAEEFRGKYTQLDFHQIRSLHQPFVKVNLFFPWPHASLEIYNGIDLHFRCSYREPIGGTDTQSYAAWMNRQSREFGDADLKENRSFGGRTITTIADLLAGREPSAS